MLRSKNILKMNESGWHRGLFKKDRSKKSVFKKSWNQLKVATWHRSGSVLFHVPLRNQWKLQHQIKHFHWFPYVMLIKTFPDHCQVAAFNWFQLFFWRRIFSIGLLKKDREASLIRSFLGSFTIRATLRHVFWKCATHGQQLCTHLRISGTHFVMLPTWFGSRKHVMILTFRWNF